MEDLNDNNKTKSCVCEQEQSAKGETYISETVNMGFATIFRTMFAIIALVLPLFIIHANSSVASGLSSGKETQHAYITSIQNGNSSAPEETEQLSAPESAMSSASSTYAPPSNSSSSSPSSSSLSPSSTSPSAKPPPSPSSTSPSTKSPSSSSSSSSSSSGFYLSPASQTQTAEQTSIDTAANPTAKKGNSDKSNKINDQPEEKPQEKTQDTKHVDSSDETIVQKVFPQPDKVAYITIDDGPSRAVTPGMLDVLKQEGIKATFFVLPHIGVDDLYRRIIDEGHEIGNHSYSHVYKDLYKPDDIEAFREDVLLAQAFMFDNYGYSSTSFRFPGGAMSRKSSIITPRWELVEEMGYTIFEWSVDTGDTRSKRYDKSAAALTRNVLENTRDREQLIILMHDTKSKVTTLEALPYIITGLREQGYSFDILRNY